MHDVTEKVRGGHRQMNRRHSQAGLLLAIVLLTGCGPSTPFSPLYMRAADRGRIEVALLPCGSAERHIAHIKVVTLDKDAQDGAVIYDAAAPAAATSVQVPVDDLAATIGPHEVARIIVSVAGGEVSMPFSLSDFADPNVVRVHDHNVPSSRFESPETWCRDVAPVY